MVGAKDLHSGTASQGIVSEGKCAEQNCHQAQCILPSPFFSCHTDKLD